MVPIDVVLAMQEPQVWALGQEDPLKKSTATHSNILACRISWTEEPGRLLSKGSQRFRHDWATNTFHFFWMILSETVWFYYWRLDMYDKIVKMVTRWPWWECLLYSQDLGLPKGEKIIKHFKSVWHRFKKMLIDKKLLLWFKKKIVCLTYSNWAEGLQRTCGIEKQEIGEKICAAVFFCDTENYKPCDLGKVTVSLSNIIFHINDRSVLGI